MKQEHIKLITAMVQMQLDNDYGEVELEHIDCVEEDGSFKGICYFEYESCISFMIYNDNGIWKIQYNEIDYIPYKLDLSIPTYDFNPRDIGSVIIK